MHAVADLASYVDRILGRVRAVLAARGMGLVALAALLLTLACIPALRAFRFTAWSVSAGRLFLLVGLAVVVALVLVRPLLGLRRGRFLRRVAGADPDLAERLRTFVERREQSGPMLDLLAEDALVRAAALPPRRLVSLPSILAWAGLGAGAALLLVWLGTRDGAVGHGTALLWTGWLRAPAVTAVEVEPGSVTVRRRADVLIRARPRGFYGESASLAVLRGGATEWESVAMPRAAEAGGFEFVLAGVEDALRYKVTVGDVTSEAYDLAVEDLPRVTRLKLVYRYPEWTRLPERTEDPGGDVRAVAGTQVDVEIETDRPLRGGVLRVDGGAEQALEGSGASARGRIAVEEDGRYHLALRHGNETVRLTDDYRIEIVPDEPPVPTVRHPTRDVRATSIEEVTVRVGAEDDFALRDLELRYSVNGAKEETVRLPAGGPSAQHEHVLALEPHRLAPGDLVSYYAVARDARAEATTDMYFIEVTPFEREFLQSQQSGGDEGGEGPGDESSDITRRQKEVVVATWNLSRGREASAGEGAKTLSGMQSRLQGQAQTLAERMRRRGLSDVDDDFRTFVENMDKAAEAMGPAAESLGGARWAEALPHEQKALQHLLRAEAVFRRIQVSRGGRGGSAGGSEGRDLAEMFELELDAGKNQYETRQQASARERELDDLQRRLQQLARRHEEGARSPERRDPQSLFEQRWRQEVLRREMEETARALQEAQRRAQAAEAQGQGQGQRQSPSGAQGGQSAEGQGQRGERSEERGGSGEGSRARARALDSARQRVEEAARDLLTAAESPNPRERAEAESRVRRRLQEAEELLADEGRRTAGNGEPLGEREARRALEALERARGRLERLRPGAGRAQERDDQRGTARDGRGAERGSEAGSEPGGEARGASPSARAPGEGDRAGGGDRGAGAGGEEQPLSDEERAGLLRRTLEDATALERALGRDGEVGPASAEFARELRDLIAHGAGAGGNPELLERELKALTLALQPIEERLKRRLGAAAASSVRTLPNPDVPPDQRDAVADYYRRLSR